MFGTIRKHSQALWIPIIIVIVVSFVIFFTPSVEIEDFFGGSSSQTAEDQEAFMNARIMVVMNISSQNARANQEAFQEASRFPAQFRNQILRSRLRPEDPAQIVNAMGLINLARDANQSAQIAIDDLDDYNALDYYARVRLERLKKAEAMGIHVGMDTALQSISNNPGFQTEGRFDEQKYVSSIQALSTQFRSLGFPPGEAGIGLYREFVRQEMVLRRMGELLLASSQFFPDRAVEDNWIALNKVYTTQAVFFSEESHEANATQASTNNVELVKQHYLTLTNNFTIAPKFKIAYVEIDPAPYVAEAEAQIDLDNLVKEAIAKHLNPTNTFSKYVDDNGTKLPAGADLNATIRDDLFRDTRVTIGNNTAPKVQLEAKGFYTRLIKGQKSADLTAARLKTLAAQPTPDGNRTLPYIETEVDQHYRAGMFGGPPADVNISGQQLDGAAAKLRATADGKIVVSPPFITIDGNATRRGYILARLGVVPAQTRKWEELKPDEQDAVRKSFINVQVRKAVENDVTHFRKHITDLREENDLNFVDALKLDANETAPHVLLPPFKRNVRNEAVNDPDIPELTGYASLSDIRKTIGPDAEPGWISDYTESATDHNRSDGFIVHVSAVGEGEKPSAEQLKQEAARIRGGEPGYVNALLNETTVLRQQLYMQQLLERQARIAQDIEFKEKEIQIVKDEMSAGEDLTQALNEKNQELARLKQVQSTHLPGEIARLEKLGVTGATTGGSSWRNYAIAALVILLILSFMGGDKDKKKRATVTGESSATESETSEDDADEKKPDA